ncbi:glycoside hydrolase family 15 protein [Pseudoalteromonas luteoviolacea]|uniref:Glucan 1,4-alpha-glucosidase n=1 Tax=Pseudoalteromonas luteoviolacea S4054 TaxID=1129367 RepID=A0A0F6A5I7_9GAMM|nr:glycoside hydrolase family 15 protein [Pseudoalteromonas luteoviolacea]AOT07618.1 glucan 1,4-alpha-glucosidase [Pseudoalteromonas luteoviolacea]AOT12534.1 glucan 1,4-alpha-glucosidase [Pseudoalteromonas luteoviolacea]AOT17448.1 glucan 1,4-alpha-glucosidase [Pseudoalteromonas luteoviolacea]KKE81358.1 glucan 1,4-alpha-glucosidase [Pseudoalteromonas luteoviolacea S4054]KZN70633.1 glucan 1,4-alpha-glucosidase [Pseudoalteromonas luteoviolacea S4047-1]
MKKLSCLSLALIAAGLIGCGSATNTQQIKTAPGAPGDKPFWTYSDKTGIGTSYEVYKNGQYANDAQTGEVSKVWFSIAKGMITETMFGLIHQAQIRDMQFVVTGKDFTVTERDELEVSIDYLYKDNQGRPLSLAYKVVSTDKQGRFTLEKHIFTDPDGQTLFVRAKVDTQLSGVKAFVNVNPYVNNNGLNDSATVTDKGLVAWEADNFLTLQSSTGFEQASVGFTGSSDNLNELKKSHALTSTYQRTGDTKGNVNWLAELGEVKGSATFDLALSFGKSQAESFAQGAAALNKGYNKVLAHYNGQGDYIGWEDYLTSLKPMQRLANYTTDSGKLLNVSALVLKAQEDKTHAGALIASLSNPWGDTVAAEQGHTGYKAVWVRDFYQVAMAFMAMGDPDTALTSFEYLEKVQVMDGTPGNQGDTGWFLQKTHVDGELEWVGVQLDQTAMPVMLAWKLWQAGVLSDEKLVYWYERMLKPAAEFLVDGGLAKILWNDTQITPPATQQERWEEQDGYSPSTTAAIIAGLVTASDIAKLAGDKAGEQRYLDTAKKYNDTVEKLMFTTEGNLKGQDTDGEYFFRIARDENPNTSTKLGDNNGRTGLDKRQIIDGGFLELVRYGVRGADAPSILKTLPEYEDETLPENLRVKYSFTFAGDPNSYPGYRRYGNDGYGEDEVKGTNYAEGGQNTPGQRGRVWPFFTGEKGHYEIAAAAATKGLTKDVVTRIKHTYVRGMEHFANEGLMLPEQVWDGVGVNPFGYQLGEGTNSATPLAWTHAEYVKLVRSLADKNVWDHYPIVSEKLK